MIVGIGVDIIDINRVKAGFEKMSVRYADKFLTDKEREAWDQIKLDELKINWLAKRICAKEAVVKALGTGFRNGIHWKLIQIGHDELGKPLVTLFEVARDRLDEIQGKKILLSISDEKQMAIAYAQVQS